EVLMRTNQALERGAVLGPRLPELLVERRPMHRFAGGRHPGGGHSRGQCDGCSENHGTGSPAIPHVTPPGARYCVVGQHKKCTNSAGLVLLAWRHWDQSHTRRGVAARSPTRMALWLKRRPSARASSSARSKTRKLGSVGQSPRSATLSPGR